MSAWDGDDLPGLPPRLGAAMEFERQHGRGETSAEVDTSEVLGANPDNPTTKLLRVLMNERYAPELLPWEGQLVEDVLEKLHQQSQMVEYLRSDDTTSEDEHFRMSYVQLDMERIKFQIRSYVRTRLYKIEKYASHIMANPDIQSRMSVLEQNHAMSYKNLFKAHMHRTVLDNLPEGLRSLNETFPDGRSMVPQPNLNQGIFIYAIQDCGPVRLPDGTSVVVDKGSIHIFQYGTIKHLVERGDAMFI
ncbi:DNA replication complex GINS protein SLD5 [Rhizoctonia solani]|uniref:DNA replication complex GINS protein SLD5 n=1 Tax=Rhizoctonia solani TaxID=456999 RepID=A0A8H8SZI0_9AGAM|nr:DNA replication complex GINS protein SLD5 [Rhizoctonia solani]QRW22647.1 DNA replication complex GINS protein SLD5 [Rhizoctonia solani]